VEATRWLACVDHVDTAPEPPSGVPSFESNRAASRGFLCEHGVEAMARDARLADSLEPVWSPWKTVTLGLLATSRWMQGDVDDALLDYAESIDVAEQTQAWVPMTRMLALRAVLEMDLGDWDAAANDIDRSVAVIGTHDLSEYASSATTCAAAARLSLHRADHAAARAALVPAMKLREQVSWATPWAGLGGTPSPTRQRSARAPRPSGSKDHPSRDRGRAAPPPPTGGLQRPDRHPA
jgi:hypothetical protein